MTDFSEITHPTRIRILKDLLERPKNLKDIAENLQISKPEISRHLSTLRNLSLVQKEDTLNVISILGVVILRILGPLDLIVQHYDFFQDHPLVNFPSELLFGLNRLQDSELIIGTGFIFQKQMEVAKYIPKTMKLMINTPVPNVTGVVFEDGQFIVPSSTHDSIFNHAQLSKDIHCYEFRKFPEVNYSIFIIGDQYGFLHFPNKDGLPDINTCFFIKNPDGITYLLSLWECFWNKSTNFFKSPNHL